MELEDLDQMPAGPELDAFVAQRVFGKKVLLVEPPGIGGAYVFDDEQRELVPRYSTEKASAIWVLDEIKRVERDAVTQLSQVRGQNEWKVLRGPGGAVLARGDSYALAVCRAALKLIGSS